MASKHDIMWLNRVNSTNEYVKMNIDTLDNMSVVAAFNQTEGKGQGDHTWTSEPGMNLTASIFLNKIAISPSQQKLISDITAESVVELLENHGIKAWIKPPNDIWVEDRKICGILIEHAVRGQSISHSIIGVGLNINQTTFPSELPNPTSMALEKEGGDIGNILDEFLDIFFTRALPLLQMQDSQP